MGSFTYTNFISYLGNGAGANDPLESLNGGTITDGDMDTEFETGDTVMASPISIAGMSTGTYIGTATFNGQEWPAFYFASEDETLVFMTERPMPAPTSTDTLTTLTAGATFTRACFLEGTRVATPSGPRAVEDLVRGDQVLSAAGEAVQVLWIGHQTCAPRFKASDLVRISAGALGNGLPERDLVVTEDHAFHLDGALVTAGAMTGGIGINHVPSRDLGETHTVYHIETEAHSIILAEGAEAETYIDYAGRQIFDNYAEFQELFGDARDIAELPYPRFSQPEHLPAALKARLGMTKAA